MEDSYDARSSSVSCQGRISGGEVLVVDDQDLVRELAAAALAHHGYRVEQARSGEEAIGVATRRYFEVVVLDHLMRSYMDGLDVLRWLRPPERARAVVMITGDKSVEMEEEAKRLGAVACLQKPFLLGELARAVAEAMDDA